MHSFTALVVTLGRLVLLLLINMYVDKSDLEKGSWCRDNSTGPLEFWVQILIPALWQYVNCSEL